MAEPDFGAALRAAIQRSGLTLDDLARRLRDRRTPVSASALSYWRNGANQPERARSLAALAGIEEILGVPAGSLAAHLSPRGRRGPRRPRALGLRHDQFWKDPEAQARALAKIDASPPDTRNPHKLSQHVAYRVDRNGHLESVRVRRLVRADRDDTSRILFTSQFTTLPRPPAITHTEGCKPTRFRADVPSSTCVFEFALDRPLRAGELASVEFGLRFPPGQDDELVLLNVARPSRDLTLQVTFDPRRRPARCYGYYQARHDLPRGQLVTADLAQPPHTIQFITLDPAPGGYGIAWDW